MPTWCFFFFFFANFSLTGGPSRLVTSSKRRVHKAEDSDGGSGFLLDEQWRLTATFTAGRSENMIGTCNGLLCFLDGSQGSITVVEPFTGESLALPLPPETPRRHEPNAY